MRFAQKGWKTYRHHPCPFPIPFIKESRKRLPGALSPPACLPYLHQRLALMPCARHLPKFCLRHRRSPLHAALCLLVARLPAAACAGMAGAATFARAYALPPIYWHAFTTAVCRTLHDGMHAGRWTTTTEDGERRGQACGARMAFYCRAL